MKYEFVFYCDKETAIEEVLRYTEKPVLLFEQEVIYGKRFGNFVKLYHGTFHRNSFRPIFMLRFKEVEPGKTVAKGLFIWHWFVTIFSIVWVSMVCSIWFKLDNSPKIVAVVPLLFLLFFAGLIASCTYSERYNRKEIIEHIKTHQRIINGDM